MATWNAGFVQPPPFAHLAPWAEQLAGPGWPRLSHLNRLAEAADLRNAYGLALRFQRQESRCGQRDYEAGILKSGVVPTRENNWHDLLNALCWLAFPRAKAALNLVQRQVLSPGCPRGPVSDAASLFDESGLILAAPDEELATLLAQRRWREAFVERRAAWRQARPFVIGHAVLEKMLQPWPGITAKCLFVPQPEEGEAAGGMEQVDARVAQTWLDGQVERPGMLFPVPVLGIPGWWPANESPAFYDNREVFRPARD